MEKNYISNGYTKIQEDTETPFGWYKVEGYRESKAIGIIQPDEIITLDDSQIIITDDNRWFPFGGGYISVGNLKEISKEGIENLIKKKLEKVKDIELQTQQLDTEKNILIKQIISDFEKLCVWNDNNNVSKE